LIGVMGGSFSAEGDSGSLIVTQAAANPVALLFAGSDTDTVANPVSNVLSFFASGSNSTTFVGGGAHQVIGCSLPNAPQSASKTVQSAPLSAEVMQRAVSARDAHASELMAHPEVQAVGVGASYDNPAEPAIIFFVTKGQPHSDIPAQVDGVRTRIVQGDLFAQRGSLSAEQSAQLEKSVAAPEAIAPISDAEYQRALAVHTAHANELMKLAGVHGVGITASLDSPGESALIVFVTRGVPHDPIPPVVDGVRTRVRVSDRFRANHWGAETHKACKVPNPGQTNTGGSAASKDVAIVSSQAAN
jgi:hypothetical protein